MKLDLKLLRMSLHMTPAIAARVLAARPDRPNGVNETTWNRWEKGVKEIPEDVREHLESVQKRLQMILSRVAEMPRNEPNAAGIGYHGKPKDDDLLCYHIELSAAVLAYVLGVNVGDVDNG